MLLHHQGLTTMVYSLLIVATFGLTFAEGQAHDYCNRNFLGWGDFMIWVDNYYLDFQMNVPSVDQCQSLCHQNERCQVFRFLTDNHLCWLYETNMNYFLTKATSIGGAKQMASCQAGNSPCSVSFAYFL